MEDTLTGMLSTSGGMTDFLQSLVYFMQGSNFVFTLIGAIVLCVAQPGNRLKRMLSVIFFLYAAMFVKDIIVYQPAFFHSARIYRTSVAVDYWLIPFCAMFVLELLDPGRINGRQATFHLLPFVSYTLLIAFIPSDSVIRIGMLLTVIYATGNVAFITLRIRDYERRMVQEYSYTKHIGIGWIKLVFAGLTVYFALWIYVGAQKSPYIDVLYYLVSLLLWFVILLKGYKQEIMLADANKAAEATIASSSPHHSKEFSFAQTGETPDEMIRKRLLFLNPCIRLSEVAMELNTNRTYLSNYLNRVQKTSFLDYINRLRLEYACTLLSDPANHDTLEVISEKSGFNSFSTFYRSFVKAYSTTPGKYRTEKNVQSGANAG